MKQETLNKYLNTTHGVLTILGLDHEEYNKITQCKRSYFKCKCNRCGNITIVRSDRFGKDNKYIPKSCSYCVNDLQKEISDKKYKTDRYERQRIHSIKGNAKTRHFDMKLTDDEIKELIHKPCYYCGEQNSYGIDRIDSKKHYTKDNCVPCCFICNRMKNKYSIKVFMDKIKKIYKLHNESSTTILKESTLQANGSGKGELLTAA